MNQITGNVYIQNSRLYHVSVSRVYLQDKLTKHSLLHGNYIPILMYIVHGIGVVTFYQPVFLFSLFLQLNVKIAGGDSTEVNYL